MRQLKYRQKWNKGQLARTLVIYCVRALTIVSVWAICIKTYAVFKWGATDISDVLIFVASAFGGELLLLAFKRIFAKKNDDIVQEDEGTVG